jgi:hypothetical protein
MRGLLGESLAEKSGTLPAWTGARLLHTASPEETLA